MPAKGTGTKKKPDGRRQTDGRTNSQLVFSGRNPRNVWNIFPDFARTFPGNLLFYLERAARETPPPPSRDVPCSGCVEVSVHLRLNTVVSWGCSGTLGLSFGTRAILRGVLLSWAVWKAW